VFTGLQQGWRLPLLLALARTTKLIEFQIHTFRQPSLLTSSGLHYYHRRAERSERCAKNWIE